MPTHKVRPIQLLNQFQQTTELTNRASFEGSVRWYVKLIEYTLPLLPNDGDWNRGTAGYLHGHTSE